jgi:hypothetical protein
MAMRFKASCCALMLLVTAAAQATITAQAATPARRLSARLVAGSHVVHRPSRARRARGARTRRRTQVDGATLFGLPTLKAAVAGLPARRERSTKRVIRARLHTLSASLYGPLLMGDQAVESGPDENGPGMAEAFPFTAGASGPTASMTVYVDAHTSAAKLIVGLYTSVGGQPGSLIATGSLASPHASAWDTVTIGSTAITSGHQYWVAVLGTGGMLYFRDRDGGPCDSVNSSQSNLQSLASSWTTGAAWNTCPISAFVSASPSVVTPVPVNTAAPALSGTSVQGQTLTSSAGSWTNGPTSYRYAWEHCATTGSNCTSIAGAAASSYALQASDTGDTIRSQVTATNAGGSATATSAASSVVTAPPVSKPVNTGAPTISGTLQQGDLLTESHGTWTNSPTSYAYQWEDCSTTGGSCAPISGATNQTHMLTASDAGHAIVVMESAFNAGGAGTPIASAASPVVDSAAPTASFTDSPSAPVPGSTVQFDASASTCAAAPCTYSWADDPPSGGTWPLGTGQTMAFTFQNVGTKYVTLTVTDALSQTATVEHDVVVSASTVAPPTDTAVPAVSGTTQQGQTLTASTGTWTGSPTSYAYQWQDCDTSGNSCIAINGATSSTYMLASGDVGETVRAQVTATNSGGSASATSAQTAAIAGAASPAPVNTASPVVSGSSTVGQTLSASAGTWTNNPTSEAYQWQLCSPSCADIAGATAASYPLISADQGDTLDVVVTASNAGGSASATSAASAVVVASSGGGGGSLTDTALPVIHGYTTPNSELFATNGTWTGSPTSYTYQWKDCDASGGNCIDATHTTGYTGDPCSATAFCYVVGSGDVGDTLELVVTAHSASGTATATATSAGVGPAATSEPVTCALTTAAGTDSTYVAGVTDGDHNDGSCWGQHTGITGATGCTEAQIVAQSPAQCGPPDITHVSGDQNYSSPNTVVANAYITGCVSVQSTATNFTMRDVLIYSNDQNCENNASNAQVSTWGDGNTTSVPTGVLLEDTEVDGLDQGVEQDGSLNDFGVIMGVGGTAMRDNVHGFAKLLTVSGAAGGTMTVQDTFLHDPNQTYNDSYDCTTAGGDHYDAHENDIWGDSASYVDIQHVYASGVGAGDCLTSPMTFISDFGAPTNDTINDSFMDGGGAPGGGRPDMYAGKSGSCGTDITVTNDAFSSNSMSPITEWAPGNSGNVWTGNTVPESGVTIPDPGNSC